MSDKLTKEQRHHCMASIHGSATKPEIKVRRWLWHAGYRYRLNVKSVPGKADIVLRRYHTAIFVNGCFWHGHQGCPKFKMPKTHVEFWERKIKRNQDRDAEQYRLLTDAGWHIIVLWECQLSPKKFESTMRQVDLQLSKWLLEVYQEHRNVTSIF